MFIFLDESGDLGFNFDNESTTKYFVITLLVCTDQHTVKLIEQSVSRVLKNKINHKNKFSKPEMKGTETTIKTKEYFYTRIKKIKGWSIYTLILDKQKLLRKLGKAPPHKNLYNYLARVIIEQINFNNVSRVVRLFVDRSKNGGEIKEFNEYLANPFGCFFAT